MYAKRHDEALACFAQALEIDPEFRLAHRVKGLTLVRSGRSEEGLSSLRRALELDPRSAHAAADLGYALAQAGRTPEARAVLKDLDALAQERPVSPYDFAVVYTGISEVAAALDWLEKGYTARATGMCWIKVDPIFDPLRSESRFQDLQRRIGLPD
jgi:Flp pilus assembly protein TadD